MFAGSTHTTSRPTINNACTSVAHVRHGNPLPTISSQHHNAAYPVFLTCHECVIHHCSWLHLSLGQHFVEQLGCILEQHGKELKSWMNVEEKRNQN